MKVKWFKKLNFQKNIKLIGCFFLLFLYDYEFIIKNKINQQKIDNFLYNSTFLQTDIRLLMRI